MDTDVKRASAVGAWRWYIGVLTVAGLLLRIRYQTTHHLWNDEAGIFRGVNVPLSDFWSWLTDYEVHPPLFHVFLRLCDLATFGLLTPDELKYSVLLWFAAPAGVLWWYVGLPMRTNRGVALSFGIVALGPVTSYLGAEVRPYTLLLALFLVATVVLDVWLQELDSGIERKSRLVLIAVVVPALAWTNYAGFLIAGAILVGGAMGALVVQGRLHRRFAVSWACGMLATLPLVATLLPIQMDKVAGTATGPLRLRPLTTAKFLVWAMGPTAVVFVVGIVVLLLVRRRLAVLSYSDPLVAAMVGTGASLIGAAFVGGLWTGGVNLLNLGVVPVLVVIGGTALGGLLEHASARFLAILGVVAVALTLPMTIRVLDTPALLSGNRVSPVDVIIDVEDRTGMFDGSQGSFAVMLIDNSVMNDYFMQRAREYFPGLDIRTMPMRSGEGLQQNGRDLAAFLAEQSERGTVRAVVITRGSFKHRVKPFLEFSWYQFDQYATIVNLQG